MDIPIQPSPNPNLDLTQSFSGLGVEQKLVPSPRTGFGTDLVTDLKVLAPEASKDFFFFFCGWGGLVGTERLFPRR